MSKTKSDFRVAYICFQMFVNVKSFSGGVNMFIRDRRKKKSMFSFYVPDVRPAEIKLSWEEKQPLKEADLKKGGSLFSFKMLRYLDHQKPRSGRFRIATGMLNNKLIYW